MKRPHVLLASAQVPALRTLWSNILVALLLAATLLPGLTLPVFAQDRPKQDQRLFDSLHAAFAFAKQDTTRSDILQRLAGALQDIDTATAMSYANQSKHFAEAAHDEGRLARYDLFVAHRYANAGQYDSARTHLMLALERGRTLQDSSLIASAVGQLAWNDMETGRYKEALDFLLRGLDLALHRKNNAAIGTAYNSLGCFYLDQHEPANALEYLRPALRFALLAKDDATAAAVHNNIGLSFYYEPTTAQNYERNLDSALWYFRKAVALYERSGERYQRARALGNMGGVFEKMQKLDSAIVYDRRAIELHEAVGVASTYMAGAYAQLGNLFLRAGRSDSAFHYLLLAKDIDERLGAKRGLYDHYLSLSRAYAQAGDYKLAYDYLNRGAALHDSLFNVEKSRVLTEMETKYQTSRKEKEIADQEKLISQQRIVNYTIGALAIVLCLIAIIIYRNNRQKARANAELARAKERAEASERLEHQFLANMSHEIRTPMNAVLGMTTLLLDTPLNTKQREYLEAIAASADNLLVIINDILDLSKLQAGKMELEHIPFRLHNVSARVLEMMQFKAEAKGIKLEEAFDASVPDVLIGDPARLNQILINLVGNAIKFTDHGGVTIRASAHAIPGERRMMVRVAVRDTGIGIAQEKLATIFESFSQAETETTRKYGGTGLGLTISRTLVELQGGTLSVTSELGKGSEFSFSIPFEISTENALSASEKPRATETGSLAGLRLLLVEDNEYNQIVLADTLRNVIPDLSLEIAGNGLEAIQMVHALPFDLVLMDVQMPEMDGIEATRYIRENLGRKKDLPIIALTASVIKTELDRCYAAGMNAHVPKPFKKDELLSVLGQYYKGRGKGTPTAPVAPAPTPAPAPAPAPVPTPAPAPVPTPAPKVAEVKPAPQQPAAPAVKEAPAVRPQEKPSTSQTMTNGDQHSAKPVADLSALAEITGGDEAQLRKYIKMFLDGVPGQLESVGAAIDAADFDNARRRIHAMKPHLKFMGMKHAAGLADSIEQLCQEEHRDAPRIVREFSEVRSQCELAFTELSAKM